MTIRRRGIALATSLLLSVFMLILGVSFLYYLERDYRFAGSQEHSQQAYYLAVAGLNYARSRPEKVPLTRSVGDDFHQFEVKLDPDGTLRSRGVVYSALAVAAERTLVVPPGQSTRAYQDQSQ